jgi:hypothetical protein
MRGVEHYKTASGFHAMKIHYTADAEKDPATQRGKKWLEEESRGYPGGLASAQWRQEMEIDWNAAGGELCFPLFAPYRRKIIVAPFEVPETWSLYASFDYGHRNPSAFHIHAIDYDGDVYTVWEYYRSNQGYREQAIAIRKCPYFDKLSCMPIADPSIWAQTQQQQGENEVKSIAQLFAELPEPEQIIFCKGSRGGDITVAEKVCGYFWKDIDRGREPRWKIFANCTFLIREIENLRYADWGAAQAEQKNFKEAIVDKDNHAWDGFKMFVMAFFMAPERPRDDKYKKLMLTDPISAEEWKAVDRMHRRKSETTLGEFE